MIELMTAILSINAGQYSEKGIKPSNEDACGIRTPDGSLLTGKGIAVAIADGVSSAEAGREASEACIKGFLSDYFSTPDSWTVKTSTQRVLGALNRWLYGQGHSSLGTPFSSGQGMLTTFSAIVIKSTTAYLFHVGDTRIYRLRGDELKCLTRDHQTWASKEKAFLSRAMGADLAVDIDYRSLAVEVNDVYILTTDGVHEYVNDKSLIQLWQDNRSQPESAARNIVTRALENGSHDNVTCQVFEVTSLPDQNEAEFFQQLTELPFPPPLESGQSIDGYKILRELHASNRSQVYLALDSDSNEKVILKTPSVNFQDDAEYIDGFLHEEWAGKRISNPHVLKVLEPKRQRHFLYYVSEYIEGQTLEQWISDHPQADITEVRPLIKQIVAGVRAFHRQEMIHQDLKPGNIMIDTHGTVKIIDFGSTKIAGIQEINTPIERGALLGTYDYAAPEYFEGYPGSNRSDLFSIAVIAYEMLTGKLPYGKPLSKRALKRVRYIPARQINPAIPAWVDATLEKALQLNPALRYEHMSELMADLAKPNPNLIRPEQPLLERNPIAFWRGLAIGLLVLNMMLLYFISTM